MPVYLEVLRAASETATKLLSLRTGGNYYNVQVTTNGGKTASVTWVAMSRNVTLNLPSLPPTAVMTRGEADRLVAFIAHECCHVLHSDKTVWTEAVIAGPRIQYWVNALEDVRIEQKEISLGVFPAMRSLLSAIANKLHYDAVTERGGNVIGKRVIDAPYVSCILGRVANGYDIPAAANFEAACSPDVMALVRHALASLPRCRDTADVLALARDLVAMEPSRKPKEGNQGDQGDQEGQEGNQGDQGDQGDQEGQEGNQGDQEGQEGNQGNQGDQEGDQGDQGDQEGQGGNGAQEDETGPDTDTDLSDMVDGIAKRNDDCDTEPGNTPSQLNLAKNTVQQVTQHNPRSFPTAISELKNRLTKNSVLSGQIGRLLVSQEQHRVTHRETTGRLDRRAITRMQTDARDVFSKRQDSPGINTALFVLIDGSSSMRIHIDNTNTRMMVACTTAWHIAHAAEAATAEVSIAVFQSNRMEGGARLYLVKPWEVSLSDAAATLANSGPGGSTPLSPAIMEAARLLSERQATRRILMVLTDGECDYGDAAVRTACQLARDMYNVETVGIGMACQQVIKAFPPRHSINVEDLTQLAGKGLGVLCGMLETEGGNR